MQLWVTFLMYDLQHCQLLYTEDMSNIWMLNTEVSPTALL